MRRRFAVVRLCHPRRHRIARRMRAVGWPIFAIARALRMPRERVESAIGGSRLWDAATVAFFREAL
ncbi:MULTISPECIES: hypothetical protein [unclassified Chelatococcus]|uniref:hypothetical protein n=1 Tax=unclassified Chelatococcus TaxID=2638111 RepID=UPI001BCBDC5D|nr:MULTISPECIES: hypothetical protein [unclassified Chelatococcus]MBS7698752.1 hypothetical protein [Chelatococcus sp. YT9]MBX3543599.1 hypothetical protein [Chelatococcus sp.]MBX3554666.1 hypothetical protein [Chelatococcus sp.]